MVTASKRSLPARRLLWLAVVMVTAACGGGDGDPANSEPTRADASVSTALANSQGGALEVLAYVTEPGGIGARPLPAPLPATIALDSCRQLDITTWELDGSVDLAADTATEGVVQFRIGTGSSGTDSQVRVNHSGTFQIQVPTSSLSDLATTCHIRYPDGDDWIGHADAVAQAYDGVFTWDAEPGTVAALGVGLVAGDRTDPRRAWAEQHWFGQPLPFDQVLAVDKTLVGIPTVQRIEHRDDFQSPCRVITLTFAVGEVTQSQWCSDDGATTDVSAEWQRHGDVEGLVHEDGARAYLVGYIDEWDVVVSGRSIGDVVTLAAALVLHENPGQAPLRTDIPGSYPLDEETVVDGMLSGLDFREVGRFDTTEGRFLVMEGPLNPTEPTDYLRQVRIHRLAKKGTWWNPLLVAAGPWNRCLGAATLSDDHTFVITGDSGAEVERSDGVALDVVDNEGRLSLVRGAHSIDTLSLIIDGEVIVCSTPVETTLPTVSPTTTGTLPDVTDTSNPGGSTDTTSP